METIAIGADHAGFELKEHLKQLLEKKGYHARDFGAHSADAADYADFAHPVSLAIGLRKRQWGGHDGHQTPGNSCCHLLDRGTWNACSPS